MVINPQAFNETRNGRQQTTDGLGLHRGRLQLRLNPPPINASSHGEAPLEIRADQPGTAMLSFHESGYSATTLYKPPQGQGLRVRQTDGQDYPVVGAAGSITTGMLAAGAAQAMIGTYTAGISWSTPSINVWHETPMQVNATVSGAIVRVEITLVVSNTVPSAITYIGFGSNGAVALGLTAFNCITASYVVPMTAVYYFTPPAGTYRYAVFMYTNAGVSSIWNGTNAALYMTEQRR